MDMREIERYKRLPFDHAGLRASRESVEGFIDAVNGAFSDDELRLFKNGNGAELWLRQICMDDFDARLKALSSNGKAFTAMAGRLADHVKGVRSYGLNGKKRLYVGYNRERKVKGRLQKEALRGKHYYANDHGFSAENVEVPHSAKDRIVCADSETALRELPDNCIDAVFTSPPYNFGLDYKNDDGDAADWSAYFEKLFAVFNECIRVLKYGGRMIVNVQPLYSDYIPSHHIISKHLMDQKLIWKGEILWEKNNYNAKYTAWGSWKSPASPYLKYTWEFLEIFCKGDLKKEGRKDDADITGDEFKRWVLGKWSIAPERRMKEYGHPAMFPEELARRALLLFTFKGDTILDPFNGSGTTCAVAKQTGRHFIGIDISKDYCRAAAKRVKQSSS